MLNILQKKIWALMLVMTMAFIPLNAAADHNLTDTQLHAFMGIITNFILSSGTIKLEAPTLTSDISTKTTENNITVEVNTNVGTKVYVDGFEVGTVDENGTLTVTIALKHGENEIHITVKDEAGNESEALIFNISSNVPPIAIDDTITILEDMVHDINVTMNDSDVEGDYLVVTSVTVASHGLSSINLDGTIHYIPDLNFNGSDSFNYTILDGYGGSNIATVNVIVSAVNDAPVSNAGLDRTVIMGDTINITGSATDIDGTIATYSWLQADNTELANSVAFTYSPTFVGTDVLTLRVTDNNGSTHSDTMTVTITTQPPILTDQTSQVYTIATEINSLSFTNTGGDITSCSSSPALPSGLVVNPSNKTCEITGIPTVIISDNTYTITGINSEGNDTATVMIKVTPDLLINEISSAYYTNSDRWFEIYNPTAEDIDISSYTLKARAYDGNNSSIFEFSFPSKTILAGDYLIIKSNYGPAYNTTLADIENEYVIYLKDTQSDKYPYWYSNTKGFLEILKDGNTIDFVTIGYDYTPVNISAWSSSYVPTFTSDGSEFWKSIARDINSSDTNTKSDWYVREFPTYAAINDVTCNDDVDEDGIPDCSEVNGSTFAGMDLYTFGARINQKDIFVEVDYIDSTNGGTLDIDKGTIPRQEALAKVQDSFARSGYTIHFDVGDLYAQDGNTINPSQMDLGGGNQVAYSKAVSLGCTSAGVDARTYKVDNMKVSRKNIFYYMLFGTSQNEDGSGGSSGCAESPGNDSLITLGSWGLNSNSVSSKNTLINFQSGTVMHEFGHNLGLSHGGNENKNYKPNYLSVMNYLYQLDGLATIGENEGDRYYSNKGDECPNDALTNPYYEEPRNFKLDYSHGISTNLDEVNGIVEANGLGREGSVPVDYNCNNNTDETLTNFNVNTSWDTTIDTVSDHDDWSVINIIFARTYSGNSGISINSSDNNKISINPLMDDMQPIAEEPPIKIPTHHAL